MMENNSLEFSVVIPSYLEEENLRIILPRIHKALEDLGYGFEIIIVDPMTPMDNTKTVCANFEKVVYVNRLGGNSYGCAVRTGIEKAIGNYTIFMDADGSHSPEFISELVRFRKEFDVVIASRYVKGGNTDNTKSLILMSLMVNMIYRLVLNLPYKDISNSFKLYDTKLLKRITLYCGNFDIVEEILLKLKRANGSLKVLEVPFTFKERLFGHTKRNLFLFAFSYFITLIKLRFLK